jgi:hypothetical protein
VVLALIALATPRAAFAWTEARPSGISTEVSVDHDGGATVALRVRWTVLGGRMHQFDLTELPGDMTLVEASAVAGNGTPVPVTTRATGTGRLEVNLGDESRGVRRGTIDVMLRYTTSLRAQGAIQRVGGDAVVEVATAPWARGIDAVEVRVALPTSARRAQWIPDDTLGVEADTTTELSRDVVHALRRHLPANERWIARINVDSAVFPWLNATATHRPVTLRRAPPPYVHAGAFAVCALLACVGLGRALKRPSFSPRIARLAPVLCVAGVALQALYVLHVPSTLALGTLLLGATAALRVAGIEAPLVAAAGGTSHMRNEHELATPPSSWPRTLALALSLIATVFSLVAAVQGTALPTVIATDLSLALMTWAAFAARAQPAMDVEVLRPVARRMHAAIRSLGRARVAWRVRGDQHHRGALRLRLVPLRGWRSVRGLRTIECAVVGATPDAVLTVCVELGSPGERALRTLATRVGALTVLPDERSITLRVALVGPDADVTYRGLDALVEVLFVRTPARSEQADETTRDHASLAV